MWVQQFLNGHGNQVSATGAGSPGNESSYFGAKTKAAVAAFQASNGITPTAGYWGPITRAKANALCAGSPTTPGPVTPTGPGVTISAAAQPANSLAPQSAARVPFTTFTLTNNTSAAVSITGIVVQRTGLANDAVFAGIVLVDETGTQLGNSKTLNSNHQATVGDTFTLNPGQTKTLTVAGNMASSLSAYAGQVVSISVIGVNTSVAVSGSLPISGAQQTINASLAIGSLGASLGSSDLNATTTESIGVTARIGASVRLAAGSSEDVWLKSIRWNQSGSASASDIANVMTVVDGTSYPTTVSADGKYYTTVFPGSGIKIEKGFNKEAVVKFDIVGGPNRTVGFDVYKDTDIYSVGGTYGFGITVDATANTSAATDQASQFVTSDGTASGTTGSPFFSGSVFTINAGTVTSLSRANEVLAQNIVEQSPNQPLGGFAMDVKGEAISVQSMKFHFSITGGNGTAADITSVTLVNENGQVVAGPVDGADSTSKVTFSDTVTFPTGRHVYTLKGQLGSDFANGDTIQASTTPSSDWSNITGQITGNTISLSALSTAVSGNIMTDRSASVVLSTASSPAAQTAVTGVSQQTFAGINFDATQSGEDVRFNSLKILYTEGTAMVGGDPTNCFAYDGATRLNDTGVNPTTTATDYTFTLSTNLVVSKGTVKIITIKCDLPAAITSGAFSFGITSAVTFTGTGITSSQSVTPTTSTNATITGNTQTIASAGVLTVAKDSSSPAYTLAVGGATNVTLGALRFSGTNEAMRLDRVALQLSGTASSSPNNLVQVTLWDGATQVGSAIFAGTRFATSTLSGTVTIPSNGFKILTVKGDLSGIGIGQATTSSGILIQVDYDNDDSTGTRAIGQSSGSTINRTSSADSAVDGVRVNRSNPTVAKLAPPTTTLVVASGIELFRFSISANASGDVGIRQIKVNIATSSDSLVTGSTSVTNLKIYAFTDSAMSQGVSGFLAGLVSNTFTGGVASGNNAMLIDQNSQNQLQVPAGTTLYFKVVGDVAQTGSASGTRTGTVTTKLTGDSVYLSLANGLVMATAANAISDNSSASGLVWSPNSTTTSPNVNIDWVNGYGVPGLPAGGTDSTTLSK